MVFKKRYFSCGSDLSTRAKTLCKKKSGLPMEMLPRQIDAAVLTSSFYTLKSAETWSIRFGIPERSVSLPYSPRHKAPLSWVSLPYPVILPKKSYYNFYFYSPLIAIYAIAIAAGCAFKLT